jgi:hypothetical protein
VAFIRSKYKYRLVYYSQISTKEMKMANEQVGKKMVEILTQDPARLKDIANTIDSDPAGAQKKLTAVADEASGIPDTKPYRMIITALSIVAIVALLGAIGLVGAGKTAPEVVVALGSAAIGALAGTLVTPKQQS